MSDIKAMDVEIIKRWIDDHSQIFDCDCEPMYERDTNAWVHNENTCASMMSDHMDIVLTRLIEWLQRNGPIKVRGW